MSTAFTTSRLTVREFAGTDTAAVFAMWADPEVRRFTGDEPPADESVIRADIERWRAVREQAPGCGFWAALAGDVFVGDVFVRSLPSAPGEYEIGWHVARPQWHKGYATELARGALAHAHHHGIDRLVALIDPANVASLRVAAKAGMIREGLTRRYDPGEPPVVVCRSTRPGQALPQVQRAVRD